MTAPEAAGSGDTHPALPSEYWDIVRARSFLSVMGIVVGIFGIRGSHSLSTQTIQIYFVGLVMCAAVAMVIRIGVLVDIITDKIPFRDYGSSSSDGHHDPGEDDAGGGSSAVGGGGGGGEIAEDPQNTKFFTVFSSVVSLALTGVVWLLCIRRVGSNRAEIATHVEERERRLRETPEERRMREVNESIEFVNGLNLDRGEATQAATAAFAARAAREARAS